jgi:Tol biopolymer transport system component
MKTVQKRSQAFRLMPWWPAAMLPILVACGGGGLAEAPATQALGADDGRAQSLATNTAAVGSLALVSSTSTGAARAGDLCAISADGNLVLFSNNSDNVVAGDANNFAADLFLKNRLTGGVFRVSTSSTGGQLRAATCLGMTSDGRSVALMTDSPGSSAFDFPVLVAEPTIYVKNTVTGTLTRVTPPAASLPTTRGFQFAGLSDDGLRVAFIALPTSTYLGGYETIANGPARMMVADLSNPAAVRYINLESKVRLSLTQASVYGDVLLSPDGRDLAFSTRENYPEVGDSNGKNDAFLLNIDSATLRQVNTDSSGNVISSPGSFGNAFGTQAFIGRGRKLVLFVDGDSSAGPSGLYTKNLDSGEFSLVLATAGLPVSRSFSRIDVSLPDDGKAAVFVRRLGNSQTGTNVPTLRNLITGAESNVATTAAGVASNGTTTTQALIAANGGTVAFSNNGRNLVGTNRNFELRTYAKTVAAAPAATSQ